MRGNTFGKAFRLTTFGESHGSMIGAVVDGCPAGLALDVESINRQLARRRPGQSILSTARNEADELRILSGVFEGQTTGTPIGMMIANKDARPKDYAHIAKAYRPSHAGYTYDQKFGHRDYRGGGRASARETAMRVAGGAIAQALLSTVGIKLWAYVSQVADVQVENDYQAYAPEQVDHNLVRCPDVQTAKRMEDCIQQAKQEGDTVGGVITAVIQHVPTGLGEPVFDKLQADLAKAMLSINACKGFEYGSGFRGSAMRGSQHNDHFRQNEDGRIITETNYSGGIQGGISNGMDIYFKVAFKPVATIMQDQPSVTQSGESTTLSGKGRHDPCVLPRAVPIVEAMAALTLADHWLRQRTAKM